MNDGADIRVVAETDEQKVLLIFSAEVGDEPVKIEISFDPDLARELAFNITKAAYISEGDDTL